jgi:hypothetical protein
VLIPNVSCSLRERYGSLEHVSIVTLAPELPGACDAIAELKRLNIVASMGHSSAGIDDADRGVARCVLLWCCADVYACSTTMRRWVSERGADRHGCVAW